MTANLSPPIAVLAAIDEDAPVDVAGAAGHPERHRSAPSPRCQHVLAGRLDRAGPRRRPVSMDLPELTASPGSRAPRRPRRPATPCPPVRAAYAELTGRSAPQPRARP